MTAVFDPARVSAAVCASDPSITQELAEALAAEAWVHLTEVGDLDAPEVSRRLLAAHEDVGASETNAVATASVDYCRSAGLLP